MKNKSNFYNAILQDIHMQASMSIDAINLSQYHLQTLGELQNSFAKQASIHFSQANLVSNKDDFKNFVLKSREIHKPIDNEIRCFFRNIHSFILCHGNVSKFVTWDGRKTKKYIFDGSIEDKNEFVSMLKSLGQNLTTLLDKKLGRDLRDHIEHYEERLIHTASRNDTGFYRICHSSKENGRAIGQLPEDEMKVYIHDTREYIFCGEKFSIINMENDIKTLISRIEADERFDPLLAGF